MNDPGLDRTIGETRDAVNPDHQLQEDRGSSRESSPTRLHWAIPDRQLPQFMQPTRWWITSTAIPLLAVREENVFSASIFPLLFFIES
jgi:hypothetical protein